MCRKFIYCVNMLVTYKQASGGRDAPTDGRIDLLMHKPAYEHVPTYIHTYITHLYVSMYVCRHVNLFTLRYVLGVLVSGYSDNIEHKCINVPACSCSCTSIDTYFCISKMTKTTLKFQLFNIKSFKITKHRFCLIINFTHNSILSIHAYI